MDYIGLDAYVTALYDAPKDWEMVTRMNAATRTTDEATLCASMLYLPYKEGRLSDGDVGELVSQGIPEETLELLRELRPEGQETDEQLIARVSDEGSEKARILIRAFAKSKDDAFWRSGKEKSTPKFIRAQSLAGYRYGSTEVNIEKSKRMSEMLFSAMGQELVWQTEDHISEKDDFLCASVLFIPLRDGVIDIPFIEEGVSRHGLNRSVVEILSEVKPFEGETDEELETRIMNHGSEEARALLRAYKQVTIS